MIMRASLLSVNWEGSALHFLLTSATIDLLFVGLAAC